MKNERPDRLASLRRGIVFALVTNVAGVALIGWFIGNQAAELKFLLPAIVLDVYAIGLVIAMARQLAMLGGVDFCDPVTLVQQRLQELRLLRIRTTLGTLLFAPLMWLPLLIVAAKGILGADVYAAGAPWLIANVLFGLAVIPVAVWLAKRYGRRLQQSSALRAVADEIAGRSLTTALRDLQTLREFTA
jgi:hypothetical protein